MVLLNPKSGSVHGRCSSGVCCLGLRDQNGRRSPSGCVLTLQLPQRRSQLRAQEPMRNPDTFKWMLSDPTYRKQLETMLEQQVT